MLSAVVRPGHARSLVVIVVVAMVIAAIAPFDITFDRVTMGSAPLRVLLIALLALAGAWAARRNGMRLDGHGARHPVLIGWGMAIVIAGYVLLLDGWLFRDILGANYLLFLHESLASRLFYFMLRAFNENVLYRLFLFSVFVAALGAVRRDRPVGTWLVVAAMVVSQVINVGLTISGNAHDPLTAVTLAYDALRYVVPGVVWSWLFWRFGFFTAEVASVGSHLFLQPGFSAVMAQ